MKQILLYGAKALCNGVVSYLLKIECFVYLCCVIVVLFGNYALISLFGGTYIRLEYCLEIKIALTIELRVRNVLEEETYECEIIPEWHKLKLFR